MQDDYHIGCYWSGRTESDDQFAGRTEHWFKELSQIDPLLQHWYLTAKTASEAVEFSPTHAVLRELFKRKAHNRGPMGPIFGAWNGRDDPDRLSTNMSAAWVAGAFPATCGVTPPCKGDLAERLLTVRVLAQILRAMAYAWEPDWGVAISREYRSTLENSTGRLPPGILCGWLTYLSRRRGIVPPLPEPVRVEPIGNMGTLVILTPERFTASNPAHVALGRDVQRILSQAGLLGDVA